MPFRLLTILIVFLLVSCSPVVQTTIAPTATTTDAVQAPLETASPVPTEPVTPTSEALEPTALVPAATSTPEQVATGVYNLAFINSEGNITILPPTGTPVSVTQDAAGYSQGVTDPEITITYSSPSWSYDARYLSFIREVSTRAENARNYQYDLVVYDQSSGETKILLANQQVLGYAWKPGTYQISYALPIPFEFFSNHDSTGVKGIQLVDITNGMTNSLVDAERGLPLVNPAWSRDGSKLAFEEVYLMEGRGKFAYYDFSSGKYNAWDEPIGGFSFSPDGSKIAFDSLTYTPTGNEQIAIQDTAGGERSILSTVTSPNYAFSPVFSPDGSFVAYFVSTAGLDTQIYDLVTSVVTGGDPAVLAQVDNPGFLSWSPDGTKLIYTFGPYDSATIAEVDVNTGVVSEIAKGNQPVVAVP